jgi:hypothetical protein
MVVNGFSCENPKCCTIACATMAKEWVSTSPQPGLRLGWVPQAGLESEKNCRQRRGSYTRIF